MSRLSILAYVATVAACGGEEKGGTTDVASDTGIFIPDVATTTITDSATTATETSTPTDTSVEDVPPQPGEFGYTCDENLDCNSSFCIQTADGRQCSRTCIEDCPDGYACRIFPGTDSTFVCLPKFVHLCDPCTETSECNEGGGGNYCLSYGASGRFCGVACELDSDCPSDGYVCRDVPIGGGTTAKQCVPAEGAECTCSPYAKQRVADTPCFVENTFGKCEGKRICLQQGLSLCDSQEPFPESCNQLDDNCNGQSDEFPPDYVCQITNEFGTCLGQGTCTGGVENCVGPQPAPDLCDGIDNNCDGDTDEGACDDGNPCTRNVCSLEGTCSFDPVAMNGQACEDGNACTSGSVCQDGNCVGAIPKVCDDGNPCTDDICDTVTGECKTTPAGLNTPCERDVCVVGEFCDGFGSCVGGTPKIYVTKSQGGCIEEGGTFHENCQAYDCLPGTGTCNPKHYETKDDDCQIGNGTCSPGKCGTDGKCKSTVSPNTACTYGGTVPECKKAQCVGFDCSLANDVGAVCGPVEACPPCADAIECAFCEPDVPGKCGSGGNCVPDFTGITCSDQCPPGYFKICGVCIPFE